MASITPFTSSPPPPAIDIAAVTRNNLISSHFPRNFVFGTGSAAIQVEGAADEGGRGKSIWDTFCERKFNLTDNAGWLGLKKGNNQYHLYETDARLLKDLGIKAYRFSISWSRIMPNGRLGKENEGVSKAGVSYYNNLINALKVRGIEPYVTLFHWDLPQALDDKYGGFLSEQIREDFKNYADFCFKEFGDRVKHWTTVNEPYIFSWGGYSLGTMAPGHGAPPTKIKDDKKKLAHRNALGVANKFFDQLEHFIQDTVTRWIRVCDNSNKDAPVYNSSAVEPYLVGHHMLLAHSDVYNLYKTKYKQTQGGECGIGLNCHWYQAQDPNSSDDTAAAQRQLDFMLGWMMNPLTTGEYPTIMKEYVKDRLPKFTKDDAKSLINSFDFIGMNYYTAYEAKDSQALAEDTPHFATDPRVKVKPLGKKSTSAWIFVYEEGLQKLMKETQKYGDKIGKKIGIYVTENGIDRKGDDPNMTLAEYLSDEMRVDYHKGHLYHLLQSIYRDGVDVKGYFTWSFLDSFEFTSGNQRFGNCYVDYENGFQRIPKHSGTWYKLFLQGGGKNYSQQEKDVELNGEANKAGEKRKGAYLEQSDPKRVNNGVVEMIS